MTRSIKPEPARPNTESVWDYPRPPALIRCEARSYRVERYAPRRLHPLNARRNYHPPTFYIPASTLTCRVYSPSRQQFCERKGRVLLRHRRAVRCGRESRGLTISQPAFADIAGYIAFYSHAMDACFVGDEQVKPQQGDLRWVDNRKHQRPV